MTCAGVGPQAPRPGAAHDHNRADPPTMATVLFTWELGGGLGHMLQLLPLAQGLAAQGHRVCVALRNLAGAARVFGRAGVYFLPAPFKSAGRVPFRRTLNFAHILANVGWGDDEELFGLASAWRNLFRLVRPDLLVCDHSPTALLAAHGLPNVRRTAIGSGFLCPPDRSPFPPYRPIEQVDLQQLAADEQAVLGRANRILRQWGRPPLERLGQLYSGADETFLVTFPELDHHGARAGARYWGPINGPGGGKRFDWPAGNGRRVYAYLKRCPALPQLLEALAARGDPTVVFADGIDGATRRRFASAALRFEDERLDLAQVGRECDLAVHNANHGTASELLLAGRPMLQVPITLEQQVLARTVCRLGAAEAIRAAKVTTAEFAQKLDALLTSRHYAEVARAFAARHRDFDRDQQRDQMLCRVNELLRPAARPSVFL